MASLVSMMVGQCGNQVGAATYATMHAELPFAGERYLFDEAGRARAVLVDGEAKVVGPLVKDKNGPFHRASAFVEDSGRGNNWALGYYGPRRGNGIVDRAMEAFRRQLEGLGSRLMEEMRDDLPRSPLASTTVLPFSVGELPLQHYNATLCWSRVIKETDACILFSNNDLLSLCAKRNAGKSGSTVRPADAAAAVVNTTHLNRYIGLALASVLRPCVFARTNASKGAAPWDMAGAIAAVCPTPESKVLEVWSVQETGKPHASTPPWASLGQKLAGEVPRFRTFAAKDSGSQPQIRKISTAGYQVFARGATAMGGGGCRGDEQEGAFAARAHVVKALDVAPSGHLEHMELIRDRCQRMLRSGAYLHWFFKYGFEEDEMHEALEHLRSYVEDASDFFGGVT